MKKILLMALVATASLLQAQNSKVKDTIVDGKNFFVYPYKMDASEEYAKIFRVYVIPPVLDSLPTGDYILLEKKKKKQFVMVRFYISEGKFNKGVQFFDNKKNLVEEGNYLNGEKHGEWKSYYPKGQLRWQGNYQKGKLNGLSLTYRASGTLTDSGSYHNGKREGCWVEKFTDHQYKSIAYYKQGLLHGPYQSYALNTKRDSKSFTYDLVYTANYVDGKIFGDVKIYNYSHDYGKNYLSCEFYTNDTTYKTDDGYIAKNTILNGNFSPENFSKYYRYYYPNGKIKIESYSDTMVNMTLRSNIFSDLQDAKKPYVYTALFLPLNHPFNVYFDNGQLKVRNCLINSYRGNIRYVYENNNYENHSFDTLFYRSGKPETVKQLLSDTLGRKRILISEFDHNKTDTKNYLITDSILGTQSYMKQLKTGSQWDTVFFDSRLLLPAEYHYPKQDSLYMVKISNEHGEHAESYIIPAAGDLLLHKVTRNNEVRNDIEILQYGNPLVFKKTFHQSGLQVVIFCSVDTNRKDYPSTISAVGLQRYYRFSSLTSLFSNADSAFVYYKEQPYSGLLTIKENKIGKVGIDIKKHHIVLSDTLLNKFDNQELKVVLTVSKGIISACEEVITELNSSKRSSMQFVNHLMEGNYFYNDRTSKSDHTSEWGDQGKQKMIKTKSVVPYSKGKISGIKKTWQYNKGWYLSYKAEYIHGQIKDTVYEYYFNGQILSLSIHEKDKSQYYSYYNNGVLEKNSFQINNLFEGSFLRLTPDGDTMQILNYHNGHLNGLTQIRGAMDGEFSYDEKTKQYFYTGIDEGKDVVQNAIYNNGSLTSFEFKDEFNVRRLKLSVDSLYCPHTFSNAGYGEFLMSSVNSWPQFIVEGQLELYYPNGRPYAKGKITGVPGADAIETYQLMKKHGIVLDEWSCYLSDWKNEKTGWWTYHNSQGNKIAEVLYEKQFLLRGKDTLWFIGTYKDYYDNGRVKSEGLLIWEGTKKECQSDLDEAEFHVRYTTYLSATGDTLVKNGTGKLIIYENDGQLKKETELLNGEYNGWYKVFNKEGKLERVGKYINGKKEGRWLSGDLTGINYLSDECFPTDEIKEVQQEKQKLYIEIVEIFYENGITTAQYYHRFKRSE